MEEKKTKKWISISIEKVIYDKLKGLSEQQSRSVSNMIKRLILDFKIYLLKNEE